MAAGSRVKRAAEQARRLSDWDKAIRLASWLESEANRLAVKALNGSAARVVVKRDGNQPREKH
jgi:hypothetical protein